MTDDGQAVRPPKHDVAVSPAGVMATAIEDLEGLAALGPNWDGYGSAPPTDLARRRARSILDLVSERFGETAGHRIEPDTVAAMPGSGVLLEWHGEGAALEVDIDPAGRSATCLLTVTMGSVARKKAMMHPWQRSRTIWRPS